MFEIVIKVIFALFAVAGMAELFRALLFRLLKTRNPGKLYLVISFQGHDEEAELSLRSAAERLKWAGGADALLVCVDRGMDEETRKLCELVCGENPEILLCSEVELGKILAQ